MLMKPLVMLSESCILKTVSKNETPLLEKMSLNDGKKKQECVL